MMILRSRWMLLVLVAIPVFVIDQLSKVWLSDVLLRYNRPIPLLFDWVQLAYHENTGVAFGLFPDQGGVLSVGAGLVLLLLALTYQYILPADSRWITVAVGMIFGGGLSNLVDRIRQGYVVDFIQFGWWPVFNLADSAITIGVAALAFHIIFIGEEPAPTEPEPIDDELLSELLSRDPSPPAATDARTSSSESLS
ncbi:MAG TPA: signal peptidase II [Chloroflexus aurantiacus]|uniref:Lipoprotein signal peptidase n=1 Tax=Chloroflexus aurantiacus (strain ATCC 29366 / DSM 635 / J-10-fl) TaxID=324602 RepID=A9WH40_CHLAA|nr:MULTISPECIES: signal peptidase II [Chloroflexus]ABY34135.1 lipoprotein signal peptidase [Chloroflexus aurantiacus J-10-fl]RMG53728.1 MAG: signal peptidase II [Chloroflexota bacterium]GIV93601.1 MAG: lipoprotein signal peptidase [Chloroflexus sp.]HBW67148.1 signal peptidase II [Chloroflexus aurantiacus]